MGCGEEVLRRRLLPHQVPVVVFLMSFGEDAAAEVLAILGGNPSDGESAVDGPLLALAPAVLVADVTIYIKVFTLIALVLAPLEVVVASSGSQSDVPSVEGVVLLAVAEPVAQLEADVAALLGVNVMAPDEPGPEHLALDTPAVAAPERELNLSVGSCQAPEQEVGLQCPYPVAVDGLLVGGAGLGQVDDGVADDEGVAVAAVVNAGELFLEVAHRCDDG